MNEHVYSGSIIWWFTGVVNQLAYLLFPVVIVASACIWVFRSKSTLSLVSLFGAALVLGAKLTHRFVDEIYSVGLGYTVPHEDQNVLIWFLFLHGVNLGLFLYGAALSIYFYKQKAV